MIAALDVHYSETKAHAAAVVFNDWQSEEIVATYSATEPPVAEYEPGKFYLRELSPLLRVIKKIKLQVQTYVVDAYCHLSPDRTPGLGAHLHQALPPGALVVGVAKNRFRQTVHAAEVCRGESDKPLFVTAIGMDNETAGNHVKLMAGKYRFPTMLQKVDRLARDGVE